MSAAKKLLLPMALLLVAAVFVWVYYTIDPSLHRWMPKCPFRLLTGWQCPACGNQRALYALLHGQLGAAVAYNPFLFLSAPYLLALVVATALRRARPALYARVAHPRVVMTYVVLICLWWVVRNIV